MRLVVAVGGNALLERGDVPTASAQEQHVEAAVASLLPLARSHDLVITHGNGPQVGLLANESALDPVLPAPYPFDVLGSQTQGMIGYLFLQAFENALPGRKVVSLVCQTEVDGDDPAFSAPTKFVGPVYARDEAERLAAERGWQIRVDGDAWRRVVPSPEPVAMLELATIVTLLAEGAIVICAGGGGVPVVRAANGAVHGVEAVIDKDLSAALLARSIGADSLLILTDVANVIAGYGTASATPIGHTTPTELRALEFPAGSMGPKIEAACRFVEATGKPAMIGRLDDAAGLLAGSSGTIVEPAREPPSCRETGGSLEATSLLSDPIEAIDEIAGGWSERHHDEADRNARAAVEREQFLQDFESTGDSVIPPAMQAAADRLKRDGGGGAVEVHLGVGPHGPRIILWMALDGPVSEKPREDRNPYLRIEADVPHRKVAIWEGDMWDNKGGSGPSTRLDLAEISAAGITKRVLEIFRRAASHNLMLTSLE